MSRVDDLIEQGARQCSAKYRKVFIWPKNPAVWLKENSPDVYDRCVDKALQFFENECTRLAVSTNASDRQIQLTPEEWREFKLKTTGKEPFTFEGRTPCPDCKSFGHMHQRDCPHAEPRIANP